MTMKRLNASRACGVAFAATMLPAFACARSMLYHYDFDAVEDGVLVCAGVNNGTGTVEPVLKQVETSPLGYVEDGALGSSHAFCASTRSSIWLGDDSSPLGCGTAHGFTVSFWCKPSASHAAWVDFLGFRVGGNSYRFEYCTENSTEFTIYGRTAVLTNRTAGASTCSAARAGEWQHFAIVAAPNGTNNVGTCAFYIDGVKIGDVSLQAGGELQQLNIGQWVRDKDGSDRNQSGVNNTGIDELAVFDYPATVEQLKWLARFRPAQPMNCPGRAMPLAYLLDTVQDTAGNGVVAANSGTGTDVAYKWQSGYANWSSDGALGSAYALRLKDTTTFRVDGASEADGLGAGLDSGMTLSFWVKGPTKVTAWRDFLSFRIGDRYEYFEWIDHDPKKFMVYGTSNSSDGITLDSDVWQNVCMTWNSAESKMEFYIDGEKAGMSLPLANATSADVLKSLTFGPCVFNKTGGKRSQGESQNVYLDEIAVFNHSLSSSQIRWLSRNVPTLPPLDSTNLVRMITAGGAWAGGRAAWGVREWDSENRRWLTTMRTTIYPSLEDTEVEAEVTLADGVVVTNDTFVTPKRLLLVASTTPVAQPATIVCPDGSMFDPAVLELGEGMKLSVAAGAIRMETGTIKFDEGSCVVVDCGGIGDKWTEVLSANSFTLSGQSENILDYVIADKGGYMLKIEGGRVMCKKASGLIITLR